ncbi:MAG: site-specific DNA-methyltransferase [Deltaproteobacteria bacterium]|nr:site-specific DNA-methyltransferase [Deltaproteobacteria bacterium]
MVEPFGLRYAGKDGAILQAHEEPRCRLQASAASSWGFGSARDALIEGDNLEALKLMRPAYAASVDAIYIDPPYNTGHDFVYRDRFAEATGDYLRRSGQADEAGARLVANPESHGRFHSHWLAMMEPRLRLAHELLADDGLMFVSIDDNEAHHLRVLLDEIFGPECFVAQVVVVGNRGGRDYLRIATTHEYLLCYGKTPDAPVRPLPRTGPLPRHRDDKGPYELRELRNRNPRFSPANRPNLFYPIHVDPERADDDGLCPVSLTPSAGTECVEPRNKEGAESVWRWGQPRLTAAIATGDTAGSEVVARRRRDGVFNIYEKYRAQTTKARSLWDESEFRSEQGTRTLRERLGVAAFDHPKPIALVQRCLQLATDGDGLVLDFFAGSGTTAEAVYQLDALDGGTRRFVLVQLPEVLAEDAPARALGAETIADITRLRVAAARPADRGLRDFRLVDRSTPPPELDPWDVAAAAGFPLSARVSELGPRTWRLGHGERSMVVCGLPSVSRTQVEGWGLHASTSIACRAEALDDTLAFNLARRHRLSLL